MFWLPRPGLAFAELYGRCHDCLASLPYPDLFDWWELTGETVELCRECRDQNARLYDWLFPEGRISPHQGAID